MYCQFPFIDISEFNFTNNSPKSLKRNAGLLTFSELTFDKGAFTFSKNNDFVNFLKNEGFEMNIYL